MNHIHLISLGLKKKHFSELFAKIFNIQTGLRTMLDTFQRKVLLVPYISPFIVSLLLTLSSLTPFL